MTKFKKLMNISLIFIFFITLAGCVKKQNDDNNNNNNNNIVLPTTISDIDQMFSKIEGGFYQISDLLDPVFEDSIPEGALIQLIAVVGHEGIMGICFDSETNRDNAIEMLDELFETIKPYYSYLNRDDTTKKVVGKWYYWGTTKMIDFFEGRIDHSQMLPNLPTDTNHIKTILEELGYETQIHNFTEEDGVEFERGYISSILAVKESTKDGVLAIYMESHDKILEKYDLIIDELTDSFNDFLVYEYDIELYSTSFGKMGRWVFVGTKDCINLLFK